MRSEELDGFLAYLLATFILSHAAVRQMRKQGRGGAIVNIGTILSSNGVHGLPSNAPIAAQGGMTALTKNLSVELAAENIRINAVSPGSEAVRSRSFESNGLSLRPRIRRRTLTTSNRCTEIPCRSINSQIGDSPMDPRFVTKSMHAFLDYPVALTLIGAPFLFGLGASHWLALWLSVGTGAAAFLLTLFTDHKLGVCRLLPYTAHLAVDFLVGAMFLLAPSILGFTGLDAWYYWANGAAVLIVVGLHKPEQAPALVGAHA